MTKIGYLSRQAHTWIFVLGVLGICALLYYFSHVAYVKVNITTSVTTFLQVYWGNEQSGYAEERSKVIRVFKDKKNYLFTIPHTANITRIRIDPTIREKTLVILRYFAIYQDGYKRIRLVTPQDFKQLRMVKDIGSNNISKNGLKLKTTGRDAQLELQITPQRLRGTYMTNFFRLLLLTVLAWFVYYLFSTKPQQQQVA